MVRHIIVICCAHVQMKVVGLATVKQTIGTLLLRSLEGCVDKAHFELYECSDEGLASRQ